MEVTGEWAALIWGEFISLGFRTLTICNIIKPTGFLVTFHILYLKTSFKPLFGAGWWVRRAHPVPLYLKLQELRENRGTGASVSPAPPGCWRGWTHQEPAAAFTKGFIVNSGIAVLRLQSKRSRRTRGSGEFWNGGFGVSGEPRGGDGPSRPHRGQRDAAGSCCLHLPSNCT